MCEICNGETIGDVLLRMHLRIAGGGWSSTAVDSGAAKPTWTYTTGLCTNFDHPELVIAGIKAEVACHVLETLCELVREGGRFSAGLEVDINPPNGKPDVARFIEVHPAQLEPTFARWLRYYESLREPMPELRALQLVLPNGFFRDSHAASQPLLDRAWPIVGAGGSRPNPRAAHGDPKSRPRPRRW